MKFKGFSYEDGRIVSTAYFSGHLVGDRLLENVSFKAEVVDGTLKVNFANPDGKYEKGLNQKSWAKEALLFASEYDMFNESVTLDGAELVLEKDELL